MLRIAKMTAARFMLSPVVQISDVQNQTVQISDSAKF
jgi:hypothetical protein